MPKLAPAQGKLIAAFPNQHGTGNDPATYAAEEKLVGRHYDIRTFWEHYPQADRAYNDILSESQRIPCANIAISGPAQIAMGFEDAGLRKAATFLARLRPSFLRFAGEMNRRGWDKGQFIRAWNRAVPLLDPQHRHAWVFSTTAAGFAPNQGAKQAQDYYPGDQWVDYIGPDGYNMPGGSGRSAETIFRNALAFARQHNKPLILPETGCRPGVGSSGDQARADWIRGLGAWLKATDDVIGVVYFSANDPAIADWRLMPGTKSFEAWKDFCRDPAFQV